MATFQRSAGSRFISEIELADEAAAAAAAPGNSRVLSTVQGAESVASSDLRAHASNSAGSIRRSSGDTSMNQPILYKKVIYVPGSAVGISPSSFPFPHGSGSGGRAGHGAAIGTDEDATTSTRRRRSSGHWCSRWFSGGGVAEGSKAEGSSAGQADTNLGRELRDSLLAYAREWAAGCRPRTLYVAHLLVWACLVPALVFGTWLARKTGGEMGTAEVLMSALLCGAMFAVFGKQPALLVGVSAPSVLFLAAVASTADRLSIGFLPWSAWIGVWCAACLMLLAALNASRAASHLSSFSWEVLQVLVGLTLLWEALHLLLDLFHGFLDSGLLSLWLATCTMVLALFLSGATAWDYFNRRILEALQIAGPAIALLLFSVLPLLPLLSRPELLKVNMPNLPDHTNRVSRFGAVVSLTALPMWTVFLAFIPGSLLAALIFFDHLSTSLVVQDAIGRKVHNHGARSWDIFVIAASVLLCSFFGLPFSYGLFAQSITHAQALTAADTADNSVDMENQEKPTSKAHCQRLSALVVAISAAIFLLPACVYLIRQVPQGVLAGLLLQMAVLCLKDLTLTDRIRAVFADASKDPTRAEACHLTVRVYSIVQASCAVTVFAVTKTAAAALYPLFLLVTIWIRHDLLHHFFSKRELMLIDQKLFSAGRTYDSADGEHPPTFAARHLPKSLTQSGPHSLRKLLRDRMGLSGGVSGPAAAAAAACQAQQAGSESARSLGSPTVLTMATRRRLKERSRRRYKRKISTGQSSLETTSSSNINVPLQSRHRLTTSSSLKRLKSGHYPTLSGSACTRGGSIHKRRHALHRSRQQQGRGFESKGLTGQSGNKATVMSPFGDKYHPSSQVHAWTASGSRSLCLNSSCGGHVVSRFKKQPGQASAAAAAYAQVESPSNNTWVLRRSLPSPFRQTSPRLESQKLRANSLFDPDWKDSSPPSQSMQVHENLAYLVGEGSSVIRPSTCAVQLLPKREETSINDGGPPSSPSRNTAAALTLRFSAPVPPNQPLLHDSQRAWEVSSSSGEPAAATQAARVSSFRLCSDAAEDACCYTSGNGNGNHETPGRALVPCRQGNSEGSDQSTEAWNQEIMPHQQHPETTNSNGNTVITASSLWRNGQNRSVDVDDTCRDVIHGWEAVVGCPPPEMRASRFRLASEVFFAEKADGPSRSDSLERREASSGRRRLPSSPWDDMSPSSAAAPQHKDFSPEISSFHFSGTADPWTSPNPRTKRKSGSELQQASRAAWERPPVSSAPALRPLQRTPERS